MAVCEIFRKPLIFLAQAKLAFMSTICVAVATIRLTAWGRKQSLLKLGYFFRGVAPYPTRN